MIRVKYNYNMYKKERGFFYDKWIKSEIRDGIENGGKSLKFRLELRMFKINCQINLVNKHFPAQMFFH